VAASVVLVGSMAACTSSGDTGAQPVSTGASDTVVTTVVTSETVASATSSSVAPPTTTVPSTTSTPAVTTGPAALDAIVVNRAVEPTSRSTDDVLQTADGRDRTYHVYVPSTVTTSGPPVPLLIALHGGTGWGHQFELNSGFDGLAEANGFIVVYPDGIGVGADGTAFRTWNGGGCCGPAVKQQVDDVGFVRQLIARLETTYAVDPARVFATGHSNGGILAYRLACELSDEIVAIGVQSSALEVPACTPDHPVSVFHIHGSADQNLPIGGGVGPNGISGVDFNPPIDGATAVAAADRCPATPAVGTDTTNPDLTVTSWSPCAGNIQVVFVEVAGATHAWMGHTVGGSGKVGPPYDRLDSSLAIWNFLAAHPRP